MVITCKMCLLSFYFMKYVIFMTCYSLWKNLRKHVFSGQWSATFKNRGGQNNSRADTPEKFGQ